MEPRGMVIRAGNQKYQPAAGGYLMPDTTNVRGKLCAYA